METLTFERTLTAPHALVWKHVSDIGNYHKVAPNLSSSEVISGTGTGTIRACHDLKGKGWLELCTAWQEGEYFSFEVDTQAKDYPYPFKKVNGTWIVKQVAEGRSAIILSFNVQLKNPILAWLFAARLRKQFSKVGEELLDNWEAQILAETKNHSQAA